jgi:hypothetical protein
MKHLNTAEKDSADIRVINKEKWLEYFTRQWSKEDQLETDNEEIFISLFSPSSTGVDPTDFYEIKEVLQKCKNKKHKGVDKITTEMIIYASTDIKIRFISLLSNCWQINCIPKNRKETCIIPTFRKRTKRRQVKM